MSSFSYFRCQFVMPNELTPREIYTTLIRVPDGYVQQNDGTPDVLEPVSIPAAIDAFHNCHSHVLPGVKLIGIEIVNHKFLSDVKKENN